MGNTETLRLKRHDWHRLAEEWVLDAEA